jgi:hypothetical protein
MNTTKLSHSSALKYHGAIQGALTDWARDANLINGSILDITNQTEMAGLVLELKKLEVYLDRNTTDHRMYEHALKTYSKYLYFLKQLSPIENDIQKIIVDTNYTTTQKMQLINARIGQGKFRQDLISYWGGCAVTAYSETHLLIASHIKPWAVSSDQERLSMHNGILLLPNIDRAFDAGLISFDTHGKIIISSLFEDPKCLGITADMKLKLEEAHESFMKYHREVVFTA